MFCCDHESYPTFRSCTLADVTPRLRTWRYHLRPCYPLQGQTTVTSTLGLDTHCSLTPLALGILTLRQARSAAALTGVQRSSEQKFRTRSIVDAQLFMGLDTHFLMGLDTHSCKPWLYCAGFLWRPYTPGFGYPPRGPGFTRL